MAQCPHPQIVPPRRSLVAKLGSAERLFPRGRRTFLTCAVAALVYLFARGGLVSPGATAALQVGLLAGVLSSFSATSALRAGVASGLTVLLAGLVAPVFGLALLPWTFVAALAAGLAALLTRWLVDGGHLRPALVLAIVVALVLGNFWLSTATLARDQAVVKNQTLFAFLDAPPTPNSKMNDQMFHNAVLFKMRDGQAFYAAYRQAFHENALWAADPPTVISVREPLLPNVLGETPRRFALPDMGARRSRIPGDRCSDVPTEESRSAFTEDGECGRHGGVPSRVHHHTACHRLRGVGCLHRRARSGVRLGILR